jgi:hypothetical protein
MTMPHPADSPSIFKPRLKPTHMKRRTSSGRRASAATLTPARQARVKTTQKQKLFEDAAQGAYRSSRAAAVSGPFPALSNVALDPSQRKQLHFLQALQRPQLLHVVQPHCRFACKAFLTVTVSGNEAQLTGRRCSSSGAAVVVTFSPLQCGCLGSWTSPPPTPPTALALQFQRTASTGILED